MAIPSRDQTFALESCRDLVRKLEYDLVLLGKDRPDDTDYLPFMAFNAAITAWQLSDWVWLDMTPDQRKELARDWGNFLSSSNLSLVNAGDFRGVLRRKERTIGICRQIATASKHAEVTSGGDQTIRTVYALVDGVWEGTVIDGTQRRSIQSVIEDARDFWDNFIVSRGIAS